MKPGKIKDPSLKKKVLASFSVSLRLINSRSLISYYSHLKFCVFILRDGVGEDVFPWRASMQTDLNSLQNLVVSLVGRYFKIPFSE